MFELGETSRPRLRWHDRHGHDVEDGLEIGGVAAAKGIAILEFPALGVILEQRAHKKVRMEGVTCSGPFSGTGPLIGMRDGCFRSSYLIPSFRSTPPAFQHSKTAATLGGRPAWPFGHECSPELKVP